MSFNCQYGHFETPLRFQFRHASAERRQTDNVIVCLTDKAGNTGYGEGCPREYVTGETSASSIDFLKSYGGGFSQEVTDLKELKLWINNHNKIIDKNPAAFCALELAAIDLFARQQHVTVENYLRLPPLAGTAQYTAVVGDSGAFKTRIISGVYRCYGFGEFKVKLSGNLTRDRARMSVLPTTANIRADANNLWSKADDVINYMSGLGVALAAIEEPLAPFDYRVMLKVTTALNIPVILDESLYTTNHLMQATEHISHAIVNIRVSKCGGILRSIDLANKCIEAGYDVILGAQVGETSILSRAALTVGSGLTEKPKSREGAYGKILLKSDICHRDLRFGATGAIKLKEHHLLSARGSGLEVIPDSIRWVGCAEDDLLYS